MPATSFLGTALPIIQAPMAGVQGSALAIAVGQAGALGSLPCAMLTPDTLRAELQTIRAQSPHPLNVNFFCHTPPAPNTAAQQAWRDALKPYFAELGADMSAIPTGPGRAPFDTAMADVLEPFAPQVVSFHFGLPEPQLLQRVKSWGAQVLSSATTVEEALWLQANGADAIIAQGLEAGGHRGHFLSDDLSLQMGTFALVRQIAQAVRLPVIAAGGIADAAGVRAALALGAQAVQLGSAFLLCPEATTSALHRQALQSLDARHTALTNVFTGRPARGMVNRVMRELGHAGATSQTYMSALAPQFPGATGAMAPLRANAEAQGSSDFSPLWAGQNAALCRAVSAAEVVQALAAGID